MPGKVQSVVEQWSMNDVSRSVVFGPHPGYVDVLRGRVVILPSHHFRKTTPPQLKVHAQDFLDIR